MNQGNKHLDHEALSELQEVMEDEFDILISTYLQDARQRIGSLQEARRQGDAEGFSRTVHSLKGSCINIGAPVLGELCLAAEQASKAGSLEDDVIRLEAIEDEFREVERELQAYLQSTH